MCVCVCVTYQLKKKGYLDKKWSFVSITVILPTLTDPSYHSIYFSYILDGVPRMRERPIGDLVDGLKQLGADADCFLGTKCPPVRVFGKGGLPGGKVRFCIIFLHKCSV